MQVPVLVTICPVSLKKVLAYVQSLTAVPEYIVVSGSRADHITLNTYLSTRKLSTYYSTSTYWDTKTMLLFLHVPQLEVSFFGEPREHKSDQSLI